MLFPGLPRPCQKAREAASLELDGELSELGSARLDAHLRDCEACAAYAADLSAFTQRLRSASLESPRRPLSVSRPRRLAGAGAAAAVAAAVAVVAGLSVTIDSLRGRATATRPTATVSAPSATSGLLLRELDPIQIGAGAGVEHAGPTTI